MVNTTPIPAGRAYQTLLAAWQAQAAGDMTASFMLHGRPGIGKTEIVQALADATGAQLFDLRLTTIEPQDLRGLPYFDHAAALLHKSADGRNFPIPGQTYPTTSVRGMPSAVKPFRTVTRTWNSAT